MTRTINLRISMDSIWFGLLVLYVVSGYIAHDVLLPTSFNSIALYAFLGYSVFAILCKGKIKGNPLIGWGVAFLGVSFIAMLYSREFAVLDGTYYALIVNFILVFFLTQMSWNKKRFNLVMKAFVVSAALLILVLAMTGNLEDESGRLGTEVMGNANTLAFKLTVGAMYAMWLLLSDESKKTKLLILVSLIIIYFGMFLSGGRKFVVAPVIFLYFLLLYKVDKRGRKHFIRNTVIIAAVAILLYLLIMEVPFFYETIGYRFDGFLAFFDEGAKADGSTVVRAKMIEAGWEKWPETPIFGHGFDNYKYYNLTSVTGNLYYSHNNFIELLYNQGLVGFIMYYSMYAYLFIKAWKIKGNSLYKGFVIGGIVTWLFFEYFAVTYSETPVQFMLFFCMYCLINGENESLRANLEQVEGR